MRRLYHFTKSPFSRRTRLVFAHKGLEVELREARENPLYLEEARAAWPLRTMPVLVEDDGRALGDSVAIVHYLDRAYPGAARLWPEDKEDARTAFETCALVDGTLNLVIDLGTRYFALRDHTDWQSVKGELLGRAQSSLNTLGEHATQRKTPTVARTGWSVADMWLITAVLWLEGMPARAPTVPNIAQILSLGWSLPPALSRWADHHRERHDVLALG